MTVEWVLLFAAFAPVIIYYILWGFDLREERMEEHIFTEIYSKEQVILRPETTREQDRTEGFEPEGWSCFPEVEDPDTYLIYRSHRVGRKSLFWGTWKFSKFSLPYRSFPHLY